MSVANKEVNAENMWIGPICNVKRSNYLLRVSYFDDNVLGIGIITVCALYQYLSWQNLILRRRVEPNFIKRERSDRQRK